MDYPSPRGVHVPETYYRDVTWISSSEPTPQTSHAPWLPSPQMQSSTAHRPPSAVPSDPDDPYYRPKIRFGMSRNRYSRSVHQTPRIRRDVTWISSPDPTPQTPHAPPTPWLPSPQMPSSPARRSPSPIPPSPAPTVGEHMTLDDLAFMQDDLMHPYHPPRRPSLIKSFWKGLKKLSGFHPAPSFPNPWPSSYEGQTVGMPVPPLSAPSEATQYVNPTPYTSPYVRPANVNATPAVISGSLRASPASAPSMEIPPPITIVSPSIPPSPLPNSIRSARLPSPASRHLSVSMPAPVATPTEEGSQTLHEPVYADPVRPPSFDPPLTSAPIPISASDDDDDDDDGGGGGGGGDAKFPLPPSGSGMQPPAAVERSSSKSSLGSTMARFRRFVAGLDNLPWVSDAQIADEYVPDRNPRSRLRMRVRQGAEPSWYNQRPEVVERPEYWSEWDMWAKQSTAALWGGDGRAVVWGGGGASAGGLGQGQLGVGYPHGYVPAQHGLVLPSGYPPPGVLNDQGHAPPP